MNKILTILFLGFFFSATSASAAELFFSASETVGLTQEFEVGVRLNTEGEAVNALKANIRYTENLSLVSWHDGNSVINVWAERPSIKDNVVSFAGIIPGGYRGEDGLLLTLLLRGRQIGEGTLSFLEPQVFLNDGEGTPAEISFSDFRIKITEASGVEPLLRKKDVSPPESFVPQIARDPNAFDGKWFLAFETQDKDSGISRYEAREIPLSAIFKFLVGWREVQSPYLLKDQSLRSVIEVRAIDNAGNTRTGSLSGKNVSKSFILVVFIVLILILGIWYGFFLRGRS